MDQEVLKVPLEIWVFQANKDLTVEMDSLDPKVKLEWALKTLCSETPVLEVLHLKRHQVQVFLVLQDHLVFQERMVPKVNLEISLYMILKTMQRWSKVHLDP
jgi:hypothetical protein